MITLYRRHLARCKFTTRKHKNCSCPIWASGIVHGKHVRQSLDLTNWEAAVRLTREWEIHSPEGTVTVSEAVDRYIKDAEARNLREGSIRKYKQSAKDFKEKLGNKPLRAVTVQDIRDLRENWTLSGTSMLKRLEMIRSFFRFCVDSGWASVNPAKSIKPPVVKQKPTLPFTDEQMKKILAAIDRYPEHHPQSPKSTLRKLRAFILLMRYSGIRISDAVNLTRDRIKEGKLSLYSHKTNVPVWMPLRPGNATMAATTTSPPATAR